MRHGEAVHVAENSRRPLSHQGLEEVNLIAQFLSRNHVTTTQIFHSEKLRAQQTAQEIFKYLDPQPNLSVLPGLLPDDDVKPMVELCNQLNEDTFLVGHLPYMANLAAEILTNGSYPQFNFLPAAVLCLERISIGEWSINWFIEPKLLKSCRSN
jgi:phosphohistidine phosphatase